MTVGFEWADQLRKDSNVPCLSMVIPFYNSSDRVLDLVASIERDRPDLEIVLVDDGSSDGSGFRVEESIKPYGNVRLISCDRNKGASAARNRGMDAARGDYIWFVDSDDGIVRGALTVLLRLLRTETKPFDLLFFEWFDSARGHEPVSEILPSEVSLGDALKRVYEGDGYVWNKVFCRDSLGKSGVRFDESVFWAEDKLFCAEFVAGTKGRFFHASNRLYVHMENVGSFTSSKNVDSKHLTLLKAECELVHLARNLGAAELLLIAESQLLRDSLMMMERLLVQRPEEWRSQFAACWDKISCMQNDVPLKRRLPKKYRWFLRFCGLAASIVNDVPETEERE